MDKLPTDVQQAVLPELSCRVLQGMASAMDANTFPFNPMATLDAATWEQLLPRLTIVAQKQMPEIDRKLVADEEDEEEEENVSPLERDRVQISLAYNENLVVDYHSSWLSLASEATQASFLNQVGPALKLGSLESLVISQYPNFFAPGGQVWPFLCKELGDCNALVLDLDDTYAASTKEVKEAKEESEWPRPTTCRKLICKSGVPLALAQPIVGLVRDSVQAQKLEILDFGHLTIDVANLLEQVQSWPRLIALGLGRLQNTMALTRCLQHVTSSKFPILADLAIALLEDTRSEKEEALQLAKWIDQRKIPLVSLRVCHLGRTRLPAYAHDTDILDALVRSLSKHAQSLKTLELFVGLADTRHVADLLQSLPGLGVYQTGLEDTKIALSRHQAWSPYAAIKLISPNLAILDVPIQQQQPAQKKQVLDWSRCNCRIVPRQMFQTLAEYGQVGAVTTSLEALVLFDEDAARILSIDEEDSGNWDGLVTSLISLASLRILVVLPTVSGLHSATRFPVLNSQLLMSLGQSPWLKHVHLRGWESTTDDPKSMRAALLNLVVFCPSLESLSLIWIKKMPESVKVQSALNLDLVIDLRRLATRLRYFDTVGDEAKQVLPDIVPCDISSKDESQLAVEFGPHVYWRLLTKEGQVLYRPGSPVAPRLTFLDPQASTATLVRELHGSF